MILDFILYLFSFFIIWFGTRLIVSSLDDVASRLHVSRFATSFFILGILTSIPEISVGINALIDKDPAIFVGNLIGASLVLFVLVIPLLAIFGNGIKLTHQLDGKNLVLSLLTIAAPSFLILDKRMSLSDGAFLILIYSVLFYSIEKGKGFLSSMKDQFKKRKTHILRDTIRLLLGSIIVFLSSKFIVDKTIYFGDVLKISPFLISLLFLSIGTNLPELSIAIYAIFDGKKEVALGDYIGSAAANTFIFGMLTLFSRQDILLSHQFLSTFLFTIITLTTFFLFAREKNDISRNEGIVLFFIYVAFILFTRI